MTQEREISEVTRREIVDYITASGIDWNGRLSEDDFLARLYDLTSMPSTDPRLSTAAGDIQQHRINWSDWPDDWVFYDFRFNILRAPDDEFLRFLCETVHPIVRPEAQKAADMVSAYNKELGPDGWELIPGKTLSGRPIYQPQRKGGRSEIFSEPTGWQKVDRQLQEARYRLDTASSEEHFQTVGLICREILISASQAVFDPGRHSQLDAAKPSATDAKRQLEAIFEGELGGNANEEARAHARAALRLALALQHKRTADFRMAALCAEATASVVNLLAVLSGRRERSL